MIAKNSNDQNNNTGKAVLEFTSEIYSLDLLCPYQFILHMVLMKTIEQLTIYTMKQWLS
jgi:hypothetical protein